MSEIYSFRDDRSWFTHFLLEGEKCALETLTSIKGFNPDKMQVELKINDLVVRTEDFNKLLDHWSDRIEAQIKDELDYFTKEQAVTEKAEELIKAKLGNINDILNQVENSLWKLDQ